MAILQVRDIDDRLYASLKRLATRENRSLSQEVIFILEKFLCSPSSFQTNPTKEFLEMAGSWDDDREADQIIREIKAARKHGSRFRSKNGVFD